MLARILLVDDEPNILDGLKKTVDWKDAGAYVAGIAANGLEAVELIGKIKPDIVITDVRMPDMDGIKLCKYIYQKYPYIKTIILSGYSEFEYAKSAMEYGACKYLLKPVDINELLESVKVVMGKVVSSYKKNEDIHRKEDYKLLQERILSKIIEGELTDHREIIHQLNRYGLGNLDKGFRVYVLSYFPTNYHQKVTEFTHTVYEYFHNVLGGLGSTGVVIHTDTGSITMIIQSLPDIEYVKSILEEWQKDIENSYGLKTKIGVSPEYKSLIHLRSGYHQALEAQKSLFLSTHKSICMYEELNDTNKLQDPSLILKEYIEEIYESGDISDVEVITSFLHNVRQQGEIQEDIIKYACVYIINLIVRHTLEVNIYELLSERVFEVLEGIKSSKTLGELGTIVCGFVEEVNEVVDRQKNSNCQKVVEKAKEYVMQNFNSDLSVSTVAEYVQKSPNYFSRIFKQSTGKNFTDFINNIRIQKAKELLKNSNETVYAIARDVGYEDGGYFVKIFKKYQKMTPTEYRNLF